VRQIVQLGDRFATPAFLAASVWRAHQTAIEELVPAQEGNAAISTAAAREPRRPHKTANPDVTLQWCRSAHGPRFERPTLERPSSAETHLAFPDAIHIDFAFPERSIASRSAGLTPALDRRFVCGLSLANHSRIAHTARPLTDNPTAVRPYQRARIFREHAPDRAFPIRQPNEPTCRASPHTESTPFA